MHTPTGNSVRLLFDGVDKAVMESASDVTVSVMVKGHATENLTVTITPLTVSQYQAEPGRYENSCNSAIDTSTRSSDPAEGKYMCLSGHCPFTYQ